MGVLYVVGTPIGNLADISERVINILSSVSLIAAEDTRRTLKLLNRFEIKCKQVSYHKFSEKEKCMGIVHKILNEGIDVALVSDAGTPCISDPGAILVNACVENGIKVIGIPGPSAVATAISISGFLHDSFMFLGFLPREQKKRREVLDKASASLGEVVVFYESPKRIKNCVTELAQGFEDAQLCLCRDLTKMFETTYRGTPEEVLEALSLDEASELGEYTVVLKKCPKEQDKTTLPEDELSLEALVIEEMIKKELATPKEAIASLLLKDKGYSKKNLYNAALNIKNLFGGKNER